MKNKFLNIFTENKYTIVYLFGIKMTFKNRYNELNYRYNELNAKHDELNYRYNELNAKYDELNYRYDGLNYRYDFLDSNYKYLVKKYNVETNKSRLCPICEHTSLFIFNSVVLNKHEVNYYYCQNCSTIVTEKPYWLDEAYSNDNGIVAADTGVLVRNNDCSKIVSVIIYNLFGKDFKYLDYSGGYGIFVRLMRDIGFDFYWHDPYTTNLIARGFEYSKDEKYKALTCFEVLEHLEYPIDSIKKMLDISDNILFTTSLIDDNIIPTKDWWYYAFHSGQHIIFYSEKSMRYIANMLNVNFYKFNSIMCFTRTSIPESTIQKINDCINQSMNMSNNDFKNLLQGLKNRAMDDMYYVSGMN